MKRVKKKNRNNKPTKKKLSSKNSKLEEVINKIINEIKPSEEFYKEINDKARVLISKVNQSLIKNGIVGEVFIGGSLAKNTLLKKSVNDVDLFLRFFDENIERFEKVMNGTKEEYRMIHGSRDYAQIRSDNITFEIIPVMKINDPREANNITDLSYFHVNYVTRKIEEKPSLINEVLLAKTFAHASSCYGAESYIKGFSGYAIELLIIHYGSFKKFITTIAKHNNKKKIIIDQGGHYKKDMALRDVNAAKLKSPIIVIDPTFKERNALAALSVETFKKFQKHCQEFLKNPTIEFFEEKAIDKKKIFDEAMNNGRDFAIVEISTNKQEGDIAGTKLLKFSKIFVSEMKRFYEEPIVTFIYDEKQSGTMYFTGKKIKESIIRGPPIVMKEAVKSFMKKHSATINDGKNINAAISLNLNFSQALEKFINMNKQKIKEMNITKIKIID